MTQSKFSGRYACTPTEDVRRLPVRQAFVVQVAVEADMARGYWVGRLEHVVSGEARHFQSLDDLLEFMTQVLRGHSPPPPDTPRDG